LQRSQGVRLVGHNALVTDHAAIEAEID